MNRRLKRACMAALADTFRMQDFRPGQKAAASALLTGRDLLCVLPTGAGKSLCWQLPAVVHGGLTVVVSPLIALMQDQLHHLRSRGVGAVTINSHMSADERNEAAQAIRSGDADIVLVSPERLEMEEFRELCRGRQPWLVVVDEAHCVVSWGEEFRTAYARISEFVGAMPSRPVICAMTATADKRMMKQIVQNLAMRWPKRIMLPVLRENLEFSVRTAAFPTSEILKILSASPSRTVIFCRTRARTEALAARLQEVGIAAECYHAGMDADRRSLALTRFRTGETDCITATTAFGMGVDIRDIRRVIHDSLPDHVIDLVQQSGRAGRDGKTAECIILISPGDLLVRREHIAYLRRSKSLLPFKGWYARHRSWENIKTLLRISMTARCIPQGIAACFGHRSKPCGGCSACLRGSLTGSIPALHRMSERELRYWLLCWERDALSESLGLPKHGVADDEKLWMMAAGAKVQEHDDPRVRDAMARLLQSMRAGKGP